MNDEPTEILLPVPNPHHSQTSVVASRTLTPNNFGDYELLEEVARGGMGIVYKARQISLKRIVAVKMILTGQLASEEQIRRFKIEAEAAAQLDHSGIVPIYDVGEFEGRHYFSMPFIDGTNLASRVQRGPLASRVAARLVREIALALQFAHERGVIHRDLKPQNILLDSDDRPKIADFGLARRLDGDSNLTKTGELLGTPSYMAPEQVSGNAKKLGPTVDIYSLGGILYCLMTGQPPFEAQTTFETLVQVLEKEPVAPHHINPDVSEDLESICLRALRKNPADRYQTARELAVELDRFLRHEAVEVRTVTRVMQSWGWFRETARTLGLRTLAGLPSLEIQHQELQAAVYATEPAALLVGSRIIERVIQAHWKPQFVLTQVPHSGCFPIDRKTLFHYVDEEELRLEADRPLPETVILLAQPTTQQLADWGRNATLTRYWRLLFHARLHLALAEKTKNGELTSAHIRERIDRIGPTAFAEIRTVLEQESFLPVRADDTTVYLEFAVVFLDLWSFRKNLLPTYFPGLPDVEGIRERLLRDVDVDSLYLKSRLPGTPEPSLRKDLNSDEVSYDFWKLFRRAETLSESGDLVEGAILYVKASRIAPAAQTDTTLDRARLNIQSLLNRLQAALQLPAEEMSRWQISVPSLLDKAEEGVQSKEAHCLFDLQKACVEHERKRFTLDLIEWIATAGVRPIKRPLSSLRIVRPIKYLRSAIKNLTLVRVSTESRTELSQLLEGALERGCDRLRTRYRTVLADAFHDVGLVASSLPERVALHTMVEQLLDTIAEDGLISFLDLRDTISRNQLKIDDLSNAHQFWRGDPLLRLDRRLSVLMEGVYQPGSFYLRGLERLGSVGFGSSLGRWVCRHLVAPFGGAYLALGIADAMLHEYLGLTGILQPAWSCWGVGVVALILMYSGGVRRMFADGGAALIAGTYWLLVDSPQRILGALYRLPVLRSWPVLMLYWYIFKPLLFCLPAAMWRPDWFSTPIRASGIFLGVNLALNSRFGSRLTETLMRDAIDVIRRTRFDALRGMLAFVLWFFRRVTTGLEIALHGVDEWMLLSEGDGRILQVVSAILSALWFPVSFVIRLVFLVVVEPNLNPVKFLISMMAAKALLAFAPMLNHELKPYVSAVFGTWVALASMGFIMGFVLPGAITFLIWEIQENWRLYRANRPQKLTPTVIGDHGEKLLQLLEPGFHSGTLPKHFRQLRRAERRAYHTGDWRTVRTIRHELAHLTEALRLFLQRDFLIFIQTNRRCPIAHATLGQIHLANNGIRAELTHAGFPDQPILLSFEFRDGRLLAHIADLGWLQCVPNPQRRVLCFALAGLYKVGGIERISVEVDCLGRRDVQARHEMSESIAADVKYPVIESPREASSVAHTESHPELLDFWHVQLTWATWTQFWEAASPEELAVAGADAIRIEKLLLNGHVKF